MTIFNQVAGFVMAGGSSTRMGRDKSLLELDGVPLVVRTLRLLANLVAAPTVIGPSEKYKGLGLRIVPDDQPGWGPLGGIATALRSSASSWNLIVACDLPYLTEEWLRYLVERALASTADAVLPQSEAGAEPLCAMYHKRCETAIRAALERGIRKVTDGLAGPPPCTVERIIAAEWKAFDSGAGLFKNINTPADFAEARDHLERKRSR